MSDDDAIENTEMLINACTSGDYETVKQIINSGCAIMLNYSNDKGRTAFVEACSSASNDIIQLLLDYNEEKVNVNDGITVRWLKCGEPREKHYTLLQLLITNKRYEAFWLILNNVCRPPPKLCEDNLNTPICMPYEDKQALKQWEILMKNLLVAGVSFNDLGYNKIKGLPPIFARKWFGVFGRNNRGMITLRLLILRKFVYGTEKIYEVVDVPVYYPKGVCEWPSYERELEIADLAKIKRPR